MNDTNNEKSWAWLKDKDYLLFPCVAFQRQGKRNCHTKVIVWLEKVVCAIKREMKCEICMYGQQGCDPVKTLR